MYSTRLLICLPLVGLGASSCDFYGPPDEDQRPTEADPDCVAMPDIELIVSSYPTSDVVTADIEVFGTLSGEGGSLVRAIGLGVVRPEESALASPKPIEINPAERWKVNVPIELLLGPNSGPGVVRIEAVTVDDCMLSRVAHSAPFDVGYPTRADAGAGDAD